MSTTKSTAALLGVAMLAGAGCLSNEYRIPQDELRRLATLPPGERGRSFHVVQKVGSRRGSPVTPQAAYAPVVSAEAYAQAPPPPPSQEMIEADARDSAEIAANVAIRVEANLAFGGPIGPGGPLPSSVGSPAPGFAQPAPGSSGAPRVATAMPAAGQSGAPRGVYATPAGGGGQTNSGTRASGGGGVGLGGGDDLRVVAVVVVAVAACAAVGLAATEGSRYDGHVSASGEQRLYVTDAYGQHVVPLDALTPIDVASAREALILDDEGYGLQRLGRRPLDRKGFAFKVDAGASDLGFNRYIRSGFASNIQIGYFPHHHLGLLGTLSLGFGTDEIAHTNFLRNYVGAEAQAFLPGLSILHLGGFFSGGNEFVNTGSGLAQSRPAIGAGGLLEIEITTRFALALRAGWRWTNAPDGNWDAQGFSLTGGLAVY